MQERQAASRGTAEGRRRGLGPPSGEQLSALAGAEQAGCACTQPSPHRGSPGSASDGEPGVSPQPPPASPPLAGMGVPAVPPPRQLLCAFNAVRQSHAGGRAGWGGLGCSRSAGGGRGGHAQTHVSLPRAEGGTPTTTTAGSVPASASWPVLPPRQPPQATGALAAGGTRRSSGSERGTGQHRDGGGRTAEAAPGSGARTPPPHQAAFRALDGDPAWA